jgi:hypothetical protein
MDSSSTEEEAEIMGSDTSSDDDILYQVCTNMIQVQAAACQSQLLRPEEASRSIAKLCMGQCRSTHNGLLVGGRNYRGGGRELDQSQGSCDRDAMLLLCPQFALFLRQNKETKLCF